MRRLYLVAGMALLLMTIAASSAFADSVFTFTGGGVSLPLNLSSGGITVTATASGTLTVDSTLGLGVGTDKLIGNGEYITFKFVPSVDVNSISFTAFNDNNNSNSSNGDNPTLSFSIDDVTYTSPVVTHISSGNVFTVSSLPASQGVLYFRVAGKDGNDAFGIGSLTVATADGVDPAISAVPLPAAAWMSLSLLAGLAAVRTVLRRKLA